MLDKVTAEAFAVCLGDAFEMQVDAAECVCLELIEAKVTDRSDGSRPSQLRQEPFLLLFKAPAGAVHPQRIYTLKHHDLGTMELFLVPIGPSPSGAVLYEAVFH